MKAQPLAEKRKTDTAEKEKGCHPRWRPRKQSVAAVEEEEVSPR